MDTNVPRSRRTGTLEYLYVLTDDQTRFWIAQEATNTKYTADVRPLLELRKGIGGQRTRQMADDLTKCESEKQNPRLLSAKCELF
jgi:hypothetical protein